MQPTQPDDQNSSLIPEIQCGDAIRHAPALTFDPNEYICFVEATDWSGEEKLKYLGAIWEIIVSFVDLGFDLQSFQQVIEEIPTLEVDSPSVVALGAHSNNTNDMAAVSEIRTAKGKDS
jgi:hypothetical protein